MHLFDEPQFSIQDGYIGFMLEFFKRLRREGHVVFLCVHPNEPFHLEILREACERFVFVQRGQLTEFADFDTLVGDPSVRRYLGRLAPPATLASSRPRLRGDKLRRGPSVFSRKRHWIPACAGMTPGVGSRPAYHSSSTSRRRAP